MPTGFCIVCKEHKDVSMFFKDKRRSQGIPSYCKVCNNIKRQERRSRNMVLEVFLPIPEKEGTVGFTRYRKSPRLVKKKEGNQRLVCKQCSKPFLTYNSSQAFCTRVCWRLSRVKIREEVRNNPYTRLKKRWEDINTRCNNKKNKNYGGRGIKVFWESFEEFSNDMMESFKKHLDEYGHRQTQIDRIDVNGHYCKENCRWVTPRENVMNRRITKLCKR